MSLRDLRGMVTRRWAASKYLLQIREKRDPGVAEDFRYVYCLTREAAVQNLIERETAAIEKLEKDLARNKARLRAFIRKERP